ncbi:SdrD B-like domain-containing protein, partial [Aliishimia ponticola]
MTYHYSSYTTYEFTAFAEADLLSAGDNNLGCGDTFTMPASASTCFSVSDNDRYLSGDKCYNENSDDTSGQKASIEGANGTELGNGGQIYAESYFWVQDSAGNWYMLIEIEQEGSGDDYFTFHSGYGIPPEGTELTVVSQCNVTSDWIDFKCLDAGEKTPVNTAPTFDNIPTDGEICIDENTTDVFNIDSSDADGDARSYDIIGGADGALFTIDAHTGQLSFVEAPDYENPADHGGDNVYEVKVRVSDGNGGEATQLLKVCVEDVTETTPGGTCIVIEAEDMSETGYHTVSGSQASGGELVKLNCAGGTGKLWTTFNGESGTYDLTISAQDENDGNSKIKVFVNGNYVDTIYLNTNTDGGGSNNGGFSDFTIDDLQLNTGDVVKLVAVGNAGEFVRIDKIELCSEGGQPCPEGFTKEDFQALSEGTIVSDQIEGVTISAQRAGDGASSPNDAMIFDSSNPTGGDHDLGFADLGNIIIISEDGDSSDPDDNAGGGVITFDFDNPSDLSDIKLLDIEEAGGTIDLYAADGSLIKSVAIPAAGNNSIQTIDLSAEGVSQMQINLVGSGAVDDLCWKPGEAPALGALEGRYFCDENGNNIDDGEVGIEGATVWLLDDTGAIVGSTTTDANGEYAFTDLEAGNYSVRFEDPNDIGQDGKVFVEADQGGDDTVDSDVVNVGSAGNGNTGTVTVVAGETTSNVDAGIKDPGTASLAGRVFCDENDNSLDDGEPGIAGVTVQLLDASGAVVATTETGADGSYEFVGLDAGTYSVDFDENDADLDGKVLVTQDVDGNASDDVDSDASEADGTTGQVTLGIGERVENIDAGVEDPGTASIGDTVWLDENGNGTLDGGEAGVDG